jgi:hypothetical protein
MIPASRFVLATGVQRVSEACVIGAGLLGGPFAAGLQLEGDVRLHRRVVLTLQGSKAT